jgi:sporulation protein YlmC with PRC-barrel domain
MHLRLGTRVDCTDGGFGRLADVVIDPTTKRVTHLVAEPERDGWLARLVPVELAEARDEGGAIALRLSVEEAERLPSVHGVDYLRVTGFPLEDPDWSVGIEEVYALPYYSGYDVQVEPLDYVSRYDRIPKGEVEIRRASPVDSSDGHRLGHVEGFLVDRDDRITHAVLERGHLWGRREITVPIGAVAHIHTDVVTLSLTKDEVGALAAAPVPRWPGAASGGGAVAARRGPRRRTDRRRVP